MNVTAELPVVKKLPDDLSGKNSIKKIIKKGIILLSKAFKLIRNKVFFLTKILRNSINTKNNIILNPIIPRSVKISK
tara:strand:+ start:474 stop:704 length:231 start_codon:yes stop_codon:yes gene_type:complete